MAITFGDNQYGQAEVLLVHVTRDGDRHEIKDLNVSTALRGDFADAHLAGDNAKVVHLWSKIRENRDFREA